MFAIKNKRKFIANLTKAVEETVKDSVMDEFAEECIRIIQERTAKGVDAHGKPFAAYDTTPIYISKKHRPPPRDGIKTPQTKRKQAGFNKRVQAGKLSGASASGLKRPSKRGGKTMFFPGGYRQFKSHMSNTVNLIGTDKMLYKALWYRRAKSKRILYFRSHAVKRAHGHDTGGGSLPKREFFDIGKIPSERQRLQKYWERLNHGNKQSE